MDSARQRKTRQRIEAPAEPLTLDRAQARGSAEDELTRKEQSKAIGNALGTLPDNVRLAILMRHFEDMSYDAMAQVLACSVGTVASRFSRGHRMLWEKLRTKLP